MAFFKMRRSRRKNPWAAFLLPTIPEESDPDVQKIAGIYMEAALLANLVLTALISLERVMKALQIDLHSVKRIACSSLCCAGELTRQCSQPTTPITMSGVIEHVPPPPPPESRRLSLDELRAILEAPTVQKNDLKV